MAVLNPTQKRHFHTPLRPMAAPAKTLRAAEPAAKSAPADPTSAATASARAPAAAPAADSFKQVTTQPNSGSSTKVAKAAPTTEPAAPKTELTQSADRVRGRLRNLAIEMPQQFDGIMKQAFGERFSPSMLGKLRSQATRGATPMPGSIEFASDEVLKGATAAYTPKDGGRILVNENVKGDPKLMDKAVLEEMVHHWDAQAGPGDARGDEGEIVARGMARGGPLSAARLAGLRKQDDSGTIRLDGKETAVEFRRSSGAATVNMAQRISARYGHLYSKASNELAPSRARAALGVTYGRMAGRDKCNIFVYDVLAASGKSRNVPIMPLGRGKKHYFDVSNHTEFPGHLRGKLRRINSRRAAQPGDIIIFNGGKHMELVTGVSGGKIKSIGARTNGVQNSVYRGRFAYLLRPED